MSHVTKGNPASKFGAFGRLAHRPVLEAKVEATSDMHLSLSLDHHTKYLKKAEEITFDINDDAQKRNAITKLTKILNEYRNQVVPIFESRKNSGQENLGSTILEEFFQILLFPLLKVYSGIDPLDVTLGKANSYVGLSFTPKDFEGMFDNPSPNIHTKDQDFVLGCNIEISVKTNSQDGTSISKSHSVVVPIVAIECKTYIERNMLDSCSGTASRLKAGMPYCLYLVAAEYMKMDVAFPELSDIDELYILTRKSNSDRLLSAKKSIAPYEIQTDLIIDIFELVERHLDRVWWDPETALLRGKVIGRPS